MSRVCAEPFPVAPPSGLPERSNKRIEASGFGAFPNAPGESFEWLLAADRVGGTLASRLLPPSAQPGALTGGARQGPTRKASWPHLQDAGFARVSKRPRPPPCQAGTNCRTDIFLPNALTPALGRPALCVPGPLARRPRPDRPSRRRLRVDLPAARLGLRMPARHADFVRASSLVVRFHVLSAQRVAATSRARRLLLSQSGALSRSAT
jgi:hypothetical protein